MLARALRALGEFRIEGVATNLSFLQSLLSRPELAAGRIYTRFVEDHAAELVASEGHAQPRRYFEAAAAPAAGPALAGARVDARDPLAVLDYGKARSDAPEAVRRRGSRARRTRRRARSAPGHDRLASTCATASSSPPGSRCS